MIEHSLPTSVTRLSDDISAEKVMPHPDAAKIAAEMNRTARALIGRTIVAIEAHIDYDTWWDYTTLKLDDGQAILIPHTLIPRLMFNLGLEDDDAETYE